MTQKHRAPNPAALRRRELTGAGTFRGLRSVLGQFLPEHKVTYDSIYDQMIEASKHCEHKRKKEFEPQSWSGAWKGRRVKIPICRHKPSECDYKRLLIEEQKFTKQAYHRNS